ncbi:hypothetical protein PCL_08595 [Purpureocillium lilacinum]|uniref:Secreted protein n=1 Tax=Purpureocillium lilacinum TaxID=33203 RepID=A0A2U3DR50_PURLI|nr:hypothetical protein PCL_08595 [Purpureocillium lilacinum]
MHAFLSLAAFVLVSSNVDLDDSTMAGSFALGRLWSPPSPTIAVPLHRGGSRPGSDAATKAIGFAYGTGQHRAIAMGTSGGSASGNTAKSTNGVARETGMAVAAVAAAGITDIAL